jgi:dTDP-4-dehydrorhamnose reductase
MIHLSTDYVFDGTARHPYREDDTANPLSVYGQSKWEGEEAVRSLLGEHLIIRTAWLFGVHGQNFVKTILRLARERDEVRVVADQYGSPTWTADLADALVEMTRLILISPHDIPWGTYHFCGAGQTTWHAFAQAILDEGGARETLRASRIIPISTADYPTVAARPSWSVLDCGKLLATFGIAPLPWRDGLAKLMEALYR